MRTPVIALVASAVSLAACSGGGNGLTGPSPGPDPSPAALAPIALAVGEVRNISAVEAATLRINGTPGGADFTLIPFYGTTSVSSTVALEFSGEQLTAAAGPPSAQMAARVAAPSLVRAGGGRDLAATFERRLRRAERDELTSRIPGARAARAARASAALASSAAAVPAVGSQMTINAAGTPSCETESKRTGRVVAVSERAVVVADTTNPSGGFSDAEYAAIAQEFDTHVDPLVTQNFGTATDLDENGGRVTIFFTRAVNELTAAGSQAVIVGYFNGRDVLQKSGTGACPASNQAEILYVMVPDPTGAVNGNRRVKEVVRRGILGVLAHEYQHLVNAARRVYINGARSFEETWLNEGLSTIAEELMFYRIAGMSPRGNVGLEALLSPDSRRDAADAYQVANFNRVIEHLRFPESTSPFDNIDELATRGATWQFLRYAADRSGIAEQTLWQKLANAKTAGVANFETAFAADFVTLVRDWATARYVDDAVPQASSMYQQPSWNYRSILPTLVPTGTFPLSTWALANGAPLSLTLRAGGATYLRFGVASQTGTVRVKASGGAVPGAVSFALVRTQ